MVAISIPGHEVLHLVGEGGMAQVWAGARLGAGKAIKPVAIKVIRPDYASDTRYREMFLAEGRTTMMFSHGNVVAVFDVGAVDEQLYIVMDWVDGVTFAEFEKKIVFQGNGPLDLAVIMGMITQLLCGLDYAHNYRINRQRVGIVHRDVSPYNVMVTSSGEVKLMDFGVARVAGGQTTRSLKGNLVYMPREQAQGDPRVESDLFAVGGILHGLLEGRRFRGHCRTEDELLREIWSGEVPPLRRAGVPEGLDQLRRDLLAPDWRARPHSAAEVVKRLATLPVPRHSSLLPMQLLYRTSFGDSHSGLTRFAHHDPRVWVEHMRKLGRKEGRGHRVVERESSVVPLGGSRPGVRPRAHEAAGVHPAGGARRMAREVFDQSKTTVYRSAVPGPISGAAKVREPETSRADAAAPRAGQSRGGVAMRRPSTSRPHVVSDEAVASRAASVSPDASALQSPGVLRDAGAPRRPIAPRGPSAEHDTLRLSWSLTGPATEPSATPTDMDPSDSGNVCPTLRLPFRGRPWSKSEAGEPSRSELDDTVMTREATGPDGDGLPPRSRRRGLTPSALSIVLVAVVTGLALPNACGAGSDSAGEVGR
ncbi:MAG: protein kinase [Deltaproteobacteria bacterium]|nr:protein kinase [Deltaproteobacteria bacterium]